MEDKLKRNSFRNRKEQLAEKHAEGKSSSSLFIEAHMKDFIEGFISAEKQSKKKIKDLYNHYNSKLKEATITKLDRRGRTEYVIKLEAKVELLKTLIS
jgi:ribosomal silencing factor RsfS